MKREHELGQTAEARKRTDRDLRCIGWGLVLLGVLMPALVTVENTGSASMPYCGAVLDNWYTSGIRTADEAEAAIASYKHDKENAKDKKGSFETDDFFEAALRRSYSDEK